MTEPPQDSRDSAPDEMSEYLQIFLDETEEQLDDLVEALLVLEREPTSVHELNESFRLIHSIKGSAGMMGFENIAVLTHHLENRFESFRAGQKTLDRPTMNLVLRCIDFLKECARRLRSGEALSSAGDLLRELTERDRDEAAREVAQDTAIKSDNVAADSAVSESPKEPAISDHAKSPEGARRIAVVFETGLPLVDLKARLILSRLSAVGEIISTVPDASALDGGTPIEQFEILVRTDHDADSICESVRLDGVEHVEIDGELTTERAPEPSQETAPAAAAASPPPSPPPSPLQPPAAPAASPDAPPATVRPDDRPEISRPRVAETMRVDVDRLNRLMNLTGELVVNRARFVQLAGQAGPTFRSRNIVGRVRDFSDAIRKTIDGLRAIDDPGGQWSSHVQELESGLGFLEEHAEMWERGRKHFAQIGEAIDQLTRISDSLQQGVLDTRMVPIAPLFNRFNRVVRDLSEERGKRVNLRVRGEKTELDKRMIDELGDPLVHLVRNSIDHGLESPEVRRSRGKDDVGAITLEASHIGNNVHISISDDGGGIDADKVRAKIIERSLLSSSAAAELSDTQALEYIWNPGFSTAHEVTDISGRGVGMDVVKTRISALSGAVEVESTPQIGTTFTIRLPLTLAIINSLLVKVRDVIFSMPVDDVQEIVAIPAKDIVDVHGNQTIDVRGEYIPLISVEDVFDWHDLGPGLNGAAAPLNTSRLDTGATIAAVLLRSGERVMGLRVDELLGSQDIVIKSLSENFVEIRGLSGASILGDGTVCLMLDINAVLELAVSNAQANGRKRVNQRDNS